jgi:hypothetical protein
MPDKVFKVRTYGFGELAFEYLPNGAKKSATHFLTRTIKANDDLNQKLLEANYHQNAKILTPLMVSIIVDYLGEPY